MTQPDSLPLPSRGRPAAAGPTSTLWKEGPLGSQVVVGTDSTYARAIDEDDESFQLMLEVTDVGDQYDFDVEQIEVAGSGGGGEESGGVAATAEEASDEAVRPSTGPAAEVPDEHVASAHRSDRHGVSVACGGEMAPRPTCGITTFVNSRVLTHPGDTLTASLEFRPAVALPPRPGLLPDARSRGDHPLEVRRHLRRGRRARHAGRRRRSDGAPTPVWTNVSKIDIFIFDIS